MEQNKRGGRRNGAGRKPIENKKSVITLYVAKPDIWKFGNEDKLKTGVYRFISDFGSGKAVVQDLNEPTNQIKPITEPQKQTNVVFSVPPKEQPTIGLFDAYKKDLATKSTVKQIELLVKVIKLDSNLTIPEKIQLEAYGKELSKEMYTD